MSKRKRARPGSDQQPPTPPQAPVRRRRWIHPAAVALVLVVAVAALVTWRVHTRPASPPLNVVFISIDTLRADHLGCYGDRQAATPVVDELAAKGTRFAEAVAHVPMTLPSHASLLTGLTPLRHGVRNNADFVLNPKIPTLAEQFKAAGYRTGAFVSGFPLHRRFGLARGFDVYDDRFPRGDDPSRPPYIERRADETIAAVTRWLADTAAAGPNPFFLFVHLFDPHTPYAPPEPFLSRFRHRPYDGEVAFVDAQIAVLLAALDRSGARDRTIVLVTSDHGEGLGEHGEPTHGLFVYDSTIRVPLILNGPGVARGRVSTSLARGIDVAPTLVDLAGVPPMQGVEGRSLRADLGGRPPAGEEAAYVESLFARLSFGWAPLYGWRQRGLMYVEAPTPELYDLKQDPGQLHNLASERRADTERLARVVQAAVSKASPPPAAAPATGDSRERLRSLGYFSGGAIARPSLRDPKDLAALAVRLENAIAIDRADPPKAVREFRAILTEDPANPLARRHLAIALTSDRQYGEAVKELQQLVASGNETADTYSLMADSYRLLGQPEKAADAARHAAELDPGAPEPPNALGKALVALGRRDEARAAFERALALSPDDPDALGSLADMAIEQGDLEEAHARLVALRLRDPADVRASLKLGVVLVRLNQVQPAIALFQEVVGQEPGNVEALVDLAGALAKAGRAAEAVPYFERAVAAGASGPAVLNGLGFARLEIGNTRGAAAALRQSLRLKPDQANVAAMLQQIEGKR